jgi:hypothetical protein
MNRLCAASTPTRSDMRMTHMSRGTRHENRTRLLLGCPRCMGCHATRSGWRRCCWIRRRSAARDWIAPEPCRPRYRPSSTGVLDAAPAVDLPAHAFKAAQGAQAGVAPRRTTDMEDRVRGIAPRPDRGLRPRRRMRLPQRCITGRTTASCWRKSLARGREPAAREAS